VTAPLLRAREAPDAAISALRDEVLRGLRGDPKTLHPKLFYDARGAELFERICELEEYYPTRTELAILRANVGEIAAVGGPRTALVEYGSGAGVKVRLVLDALEEPAAYVPIDISREQLARVAHGLAAEYPRVLVAPLCADYTTPLRLPALPDGARRVAFFPGSTIGNFHPTEAAAFLRRLRRALGPDGALILGVDRRKDPRLLRAAYDDALGVTAEFNRNVLARLNRELGADFDLDAFPHRAVGNDAAGVTAAFNLNALARLRRELGATFDAGRFRHYAFYDPVAHRIEMHLVSLGEQRVRVADEEIAFARGETIWTESSYKYDAASMSALLAGAGWAARATWHDPDDAFGLWYCEPEPAA
jgi:dimethylhistidine N-methyltransferase